MSIRLDPSRTALLRKQFALAITNRMDNLKRSLRNLVYREDALALNTRWKYLTEEQKLEQFKRWLQEELGKEKLKGGKDWLDHYVQTAHAKGQARAYEETKGTRRNFTKPDFYRGSKAEFMSSFGAAPQTERVKLLASRVYTELDGITDAMSQAITRELVDGMIQGKSPREVADNISSQVEKVGKVRARALANSETIRAHAKGQLDALEKLGVSHIGVAVEWTTSGIGTTSRGNPSPCPRCAAMQGVVLTIAEARGLIPLHVNCKCAFTAANVGEPTTGQVRTRARIRAALASAAGKGTKRPKTKRDSWAGTSRRISPKRPKPLT